MRPYQKPIKTTIHDIDRAKVSDGKSVEVTVPESTTVVADTPTLVQGFFGIPVQDVTTGAGETAPLILTIAQMEYEASNITTAEAFAMGAPLYYDANTKLLTTTQATNRLVGRVSKPKDANNVIWFILGPQV